jgi:uncharacterized protein (DUF433 family)
VCWVAGTPSPSRLGATLTEAIPLALVAAEPGDQDSDLAGAYNACSVDWREERSVSKVVSLRLKDEQHRRLERAARRLGRTPTATAALLLEQRLREQEFPGVVIKDTVAGPAAFVEGTRWQVWMVVAWLRSEGDDVEAMANRYDDLTPNQVRRALAYAEAFPDEVEAAIAETRLSVEELRRVLPGLEVVRPRAPAP